jgi:hypothetical protein
VGKEDSGPPAAGLLFRQLRYVALPGAKLVGGSASLSFVNYLLKKQLTPTFEEKIGVSSIRRKKCDVQIRGFTKNYVSRI